eukprot:COSAG01_NODE_12087_length_1803_cov_1.355634_2_plen_58_part_00
MSTQHTLTVDHAPFTLELASPPSARALREIDHLSNLLAIASEFDLLRGWCEKPTQWT